MFQGLQLPSGFRPAPWHLLSFVKGNTIVLKLLFIYNYFFRVYSEIKNSMPVVEVAPVTVDVPTNEAVAVAEEAKPEAKAETTDDMEVIAAEQETVANTVPYGVSPVHYYAPAQGYYQTPVTPAVVQAPAHAPVSYYAPYYGYQAAVAPYTAPVTYQTAPVASAPVAAAPVAVAPVAVPTPQHSQFHAQVSF